MRIFIHSLMTLFLLAGFSQLVVASPQPRVLVSVKPLQLIFTEIAGDAIQVELLLDPGASPHLYQLKPSDVAKLKETEALIWIGPSMETFLTKVVESVRPKRSILLQGELAPWLSGSEREAAIAEGGHDHGHEDEHGDGHGHEHEHGHHNGHSDSDAHLWLGPELAPAIAEVAANLFSELVPEQKSQFTQRLNAFKQGLVTVDRLNRSQLQPVRERGFVVTHDAYGRFVDYYGLNQVAALSITPERMPGARHLTQLRELLENAKARCVLVEPQIQPRYLDTLTAGLDIREQVIDPLAGDIEPGVGSYARFLQQLTQAFVACLK